MEEYTLLIYRKLIVLKHKGRRRCHEFGESKSIGSYGGILIHSDLKHVYLIVIINTVQEFMLQIVLWRWLNSFHLSTPH